MQPPGTSMYALRPATEEDSAFLYRLHLAAMKDYVARTWGWDESVQEKMFRDSFAPGRSRIVVVEGRDVGVVTVDTGAQELFLVRIEILPQFQRHGLGTAIIKEIQGEANRKGLPVALRVLKVNPARRLYERLGFVVTGETETHFLMRTGSL